MKDPRRPLEVHETRDLLAKRIQPRVHATSASPYTDEERWEALAHTPMGANPEAYIDFYFISRQPVCNARKR